MKQTHDELCGTKKQKQNMFELLIHLTCLNFKDKSQLQVISWLFKRGQRSPSSSSTLD